MAVERRSCLCRACEEDAIDVCIEQRGASVPAAIDHVQYAGRKTCRLKAVGHDPGDRWGKLRRLEDARIASQKRGHDMAVRQMAREIERSEDRHDAVRAVGEMGAAKGGVLAAATGAFDLRLDRDSDLALHRASFGKRFPAGLAHVIADRRRNILGALLDLACIGFHDPGALALRGVAPFAAGILGSLYGFIDLRRAGGLAFPACVARCRRGLFKPVAVSR